MVYWYKPGGTRLTKNKNQFQITDDNQYLEIYAGSVFSNPRDQQSTRYLFDKASKVDKVTIRLNYRRSTETIYLSEKDKRVIRDMIKVYEDLLEISKNRLTYFFNS